MFTRIFTVLPLALLAVARYEQCNNGSVQCCQSVQSASEVSNLLAHCDVTVAQAAAQGLVGVTCSPITIIGTGQGCAASQQAVCCNNNNFNGVVNLGCTPANVVA
ncbi:fungal hydrophobin-domain-containing protein [Scleroderma yunnanense]